MSVIVITGAAGLIGSMPRPRLARPDRTLRLLGDAAPSAIRPHDLRCSASHECGRGDSNPHGVSTNRT